MKVEMNSYQTNLTQTDYSPDEVCQFLDLDMEKIPEAERLQFKQAAAVIIAKARAHINGLSYLDNNLVTIAGRVAVEMRNLYGSTLTLEQGAAQSIAELRSVDTITLAPKTKSRELAEKIYNPDGVTSASEPLDLQLTRVLAAVTAAPFHAIGAGVSIASHGICSTDTMGPVCSGTAALVTTVKEAIPQEVRTAIAAPFRFAGDSIEVSLEREGVTPENAQKFREDVTTIATVGAAGASLKALQKLPKANPNMSTKTPSSSGGSGKKKKLSDAERVKLEVDSYFKSPGQSSLTFSTYRHPLIDGEAKLSNALEQAARPLGPEPTLLTVQKYGAPEVSQLAKLALLKTPEGVARNGVGVEKLNVLGFAASHKKQADFTVIDHVFNLTERGFNKFIDTNLAKAKEAGATHVDVKVIFPVTEGTLMQKLSEVATKREGSVFTSKEKVALTPGTEGIQVEFNFEVPK